MYFVNYAYHLEDNVYILKKYAPQIYQKLWAWRLNKRQNQNEKIGAKSHTLDDTSIHDSFAMIDN